MDNPFLTPRIMKKNLLIILLASLIIPSVSFAALDGVTSLLNTILGIVKLVIPIMAGLAVVYFFWGMGQFILHDAGNDKTRAEGKQKMLWSVIALFVIFSIMGIIRFIGDSIGINTGISNGSVV